MSVPEGASSLAARNAGRRFPLHKNLSEKSILLETLTPSLVYLHIRPILLTDRAPAKTEVVARAVRRRRHQKVASPSPSSSSSRGLSNHHPLRPPPGALSPPPPLWPILFQ
ncbi:hypothetical protein AOQ84DRAFT_163171 [Glonium stellatum]|uniref:Uncharacterized protein n=1 Tax=Glonium stellatum TaxID=574774 RepID=A0A8E2EQF1_9PEZI|nr:hypothetical protein AOQ84DRAFT_163171 [Glonium stellatum]